MPWIVGGSVAASSLIGSSSAKKAAKAQEEASNRALGEERRQFDQSRRDLAPWRGAGTDAVGRVGHLLGLGEPMYGGVRKPTMEDAAAEVLEMHRKQFDGRGYNEGSDMNWVNANEQAVFDRMMREYEEKTAGIDKSVIPEDYGQLNKQFTVSDFWADPVTKLGFDAGLKEGTISLDRSFGSRGMLKSGAAAKALTRFGQDYAGGRAGESYNRFYGDQDRLFNRLSGVAGTGQTATNSTVAAGNASTGRISDILTSGGNARGAAAIARGNAFSGGINTLSNMWSQNQMLDKIMNRGTVPFYGVGGSPY